jgi:hypothetical protein
MLERDGFQNTIISELGLAEDFESDYHNSRR